MALTISNNGAVQAASYHLGKAQQNFQTSLKRLSSGKKILGPNDDPGTLSVAMKVKASINRLTGAQNNIRNAIGFLEVQDGLLETAGRIVMRMSELKGYATQDPLKSESDVASYNNEFKDLQVQLYQISQMDFNGASLFALYRTDPSNPGENDHKNEAIFGGTNQHAQYDNTLDIYTSSQGSEGSKVSIHKALLLSALTLKQERMNGKVINAGDTQELKTGTNVKPTDAGGITDPAANATNTGAGPNGLDGGTLTKLGTWSRAQEEGNKTQRANGLTFDYSATPPADSTAVNDEYLTLAVENTSYALDLSQVSAGVFEKAIENVVFLRAQSGGGMTRLNFALDSIATQETNMKSALGRIEDVDIAEESANLARYSILMQASAAMAVQANLQNEVALMLLR
jgi:flagellin-like hook-associated protein FlgL